jgi:hypothetical protein
VLSGGASAPDVCRGQVDVGTADSACEQSIG